MNRENHPDTNDATEGSRDNTRGPLDGSTSGTIGGGGPDTGGPTPRPHHEPAIHPDDAASGRLAPDPLAGTTAPDPTKTGRTDTSQAPLPSSEKS
jgi:hypothetical protein